MSHQHKKYCHHVDVERLIDSFVYLSNHFAKHIVAVLLVKIFSLIVSCLHFLWIIVDINFVKRIFHVHFLEYSAFIFVRFLKLCHEITKPIDAVSRDIVSVTLAIKNLFLGLDKIYLTGSTSFGGIVGFGFDYLARRPSIMFDFDVGEKGRVTQVRLPARTYVVSTVWVVSASPSSPWHIRMF